MPRKAVEQRRLARAAFADQTDNLFFIDREAYIVHGVDVLVTIQSEMFGQMFDLEQSCHALSVAEA